MARLAHEAPDEFVRRRGELIAAAIDEFANAVHGEQLQAQIDVERFRGGVGSTETCRTLEDMMKARVEEMNALAARLFDAMSCVDSDY